MSLNSNLNTLKENSVTREDNTDTEYVIKQQQTETKVQESYHRYQYSLAIHKIAKIHQRVCSRKFMKQLLTIYITSLKRPVQASFSSCKKPQELTKKSISIDWPFKDLYLMKGKSSQQQMLMQFVHMCATKIQAFFRLYITKKRHIQAVKRIKQIINGINTLKRSWKTSRILSCKRVKQIRDNISRINSQINVEQQLPQRNTKKIQYLYEEVAHSQEELKRIYHKLYKSGLWVFQVNPIERVNRQEKYRKLRGTNNRKKPQIFLQAKSLTLSENIEANKSSPHSSRNQNNQFMSISEPIKEKQKNRKKSSGINSSRFDEMPIKAKGAYVIDENPISTEPDQQQKQQNRKETNQQVEPRNKQKSKQKQKLVKRQKYDPRKAIQQAKLKKKNQKPQVAPKDIHLQAFTSSQIPKKTAYNLENKEVSNEEDNRKTVKNIKNAAKKNTNPGIQNKSVVNQKHKAKPIQSKVKCWNKKQSSTPNYSGHFQQNQQYIGQKDHYQPQEKRFRRIQQLLSFTSNRNQSEEPKNQRQNQLQRKSDNGNQSENPQTDKYQRLKNNFNNNMKQIMQKISQQRKKQVKKEAYRPFEQLQDAYNNQYGARYQSLMPKLGLLSVARRAQRGKAIPVISQNSQTIQNLMAEVPKNFWKSAKIIEQRFKQSIQ